MMRKNLLLIVLSCALLLVAGTATAGDSHQSGRRVVILGDDGERIAVEMTDQSSLKITTEDDDDVEVCEINLDQIGLLVEDAMEDVAEAMSELEDMQLELKLGKDNRFRMSDADDVIEVDFGLIMTQLGQAITTACAQVDLSEWVDHCDWEVDGVTDQELVTEVESLQRQVRELRKDLERMRSQ